MTDAHCHPFDLLEYQKDMEEERRITGTVCAASSWNREQFEFHERLALKAREEGAPELLCCFALHPQLSPSFLEKEMQIAERWPRNEEDNNGDFSLSDGLELLQTLGAEGRMDAVGETGFDLYDKRYKAAEKIQDEMFIQHLETALRFDLPMIIHVRKAMHKVFFFEKRLKKLPALIFHSWSGTRGEGEALLRRGINVFFSFGSVVLKNHRMAMASAAYLPGDRILLETDAPYQPLKGNSISTWRDLDTICEGIAGLRKEAGDPHGNPEEMRELSTANFFRAFSCGAKRFSRAFAAPGGDGR